MSEKHKATFWVDKEDWNRFQSLAAVKNSNATEMLRGYISSCVEMRLPENYKEQVEERLEEAIHGEIDNQVIQKIAERVYQMMTVSSPFPESSEPYQQTCTVDTDATAIDLANGSLWLDHATNTSRTSELDSEGRDTVNTDNTVRKKTGGSVESEEEFEIDSEAISDRQEEQTQERRSLGEDLEQTHGDRQLNYASDKLYSDEEVGRQEGKSRQTIGRYRNGTRKPKDKTFGNRWAIHPNSDRYWAKLA